MLSGRDMSISQGAWVKSVWLKHRPVHLGRKRPHVYPNGRIQSFGQTDVVYLAFGQDTFIQNRRRLPPQPRIGRIKRKYLDVHAGINWSHVAGKKSADPAGETCS